MQTEFDGRFVERKPANKPPEIELIPLGPAAKAVEDAVVKIYGETTRVVYRQRIAKDSGTT